MSEGGAETMIDIDDMRERHANSIRNTATGRALGLALAELEELRECLEDLRTHARNAAIHSYGFNDGVLKVEYKVISELRACLGRVATAIRSTGATSVTVTRGRDAGSWGLLDDH